MNQTATNEEPPPAAEQDFPRRGLRAEHLTLGYGTAPVVRDLTVDIAEGESEGKPRRTATPPRIGAHHHSAPPEGGKQKSLLVRVAGQPGPAAHCPHTFQCLATRR